jgi:site-specific DNA-methyltransferase (adenine-specific)
MIENNLYYSEDENNLWLYCGDCLQLMKYIDDKSIDMILCDLPYGTTACKWDTIIPFEPLWEQYKRIIKDSGAIVLTGSQPFTSALVMSNVKMFKYEWIWEKTVAGNFIQAKNSPLKIHENILVFSSGVVIHKGQSRRRMVYNPQGVKEVNKEWHRPQIYDSEHNYRRPSHTTDRKITQEKFPNSILEFGSEHNPPHPTQKPVALFKYLIKTYTNVGDLVLDNCVGSGTTLVACKELGRKGIGIEKEEKYCVIAKQRIVDTVIPLLKEGNV